MTDALHGTVSQYLKLAVSQDFIGWRRFMEGMTSKEILIIQQEYMDLRGDRGTPTTPTYWSKGLIVHLIEITHGQWMYLNVHMHDTVTGLHATRRKGELQKEISIKFRWGEKHWWRMINNYWISIWRIRRLHTEKDNNTGSLPCNLHERQVY